MPNYLVYRFPLFRSPMAIVSRGVYPIYITRKCNQSRDLSMTRLYTVIVLPYTICYLSGINYQTQNIVIVNLQAVLHFTSIYTLVYRCLRISL